MTAKVKTKERILITARQLFNRRGYANVTLAMLAQELGIAKGNLWYHFNDKRSLLDALSLEFIERDKLRRAIRPKDQSVLEDYSNLLVHLLYEIRDYRFLFRDQTDYGEHSQEMRAQLPQILDESIEQFKLFFRAMKKAEYLDIKNNRIHSLAENVVIVLRYNLEFMRERQLLTMEDSGSVLATFEQHLTLFSDHLSPQAVKLLRRSLATHRQTDYAA